MALIKSNAAKNSAANAVVSLVDIGSSYPSSTLRIFTSDATVITSHSLSDPSFTDATDGTSYANFIYDATAQIDGTADNFGFYDKDGTFVWGGEVSGAPGSGDLKLSNVSIVSDSTIAISSGYYVVP